MKRLLDPTVRDQLEQKHSDTFGPIPDPEKNWDGFNTYATQLSEHGFPTDAQLLLGSIRTPDLENPIEAQAKKAVTREQRAERLKSAWTNRDSSGRFPDKKKLLILGAVPGVVLIGWLLYATTPKPKAPVAAVPTTEENVASFESDTVNAEGTDAELLVPEGDPTAEVPVAPTDGSTPTGAIPTNPSVIGDNAAQPSTGPSIELDPGVSQPPTTPPQYLPPAAVPSSPVVSQPPTVSAPTPLSPPSAPTDYTPVPVPNLGSLPEPGTGGQVTLTSPGGASTPAAPASRATVYTRPATPPASTQASAAPSSRVYQRDSTRSTTPTAPVKPVYQRPAPSAPATSTIYKAESSTPSAAPGVPGQNNTGSVVYQRKGSEQAGAGGTPKNIVMYRRDGAPVRSGANAAATTPASAAPTGQPGPATITTEGVSAPVASAPASAAPTAAGAPSNVLYSRKANAAAQAAAPTAQPAGPAYTTGQQLPAVLSTRVVAAMGASVPVIAQTQDGAMWIGVAQIDLTKRMQITFDRVVIGGREIQVQAMAFTTDGAPGLNASVTDQAPTFATEALRAGVSGVNTYVQGLLNASTTTTNPNGTTVVTKTPPSLTDSILSNITGLFTLPKETQTFIAVGEVPKGTSLLVVVGVGSKGGNLR